MIPYGKQNINQKDIDSVIEVMSSDFLTQGPITPLFEEKLQKYCEVKYAVATINDTSALHLSCLAIGIKKGDFVWTSPITFVASANCIKYCGGNLDLVDIDPLTYNISIESLKSKLVEAKTKNRLPKAIITVHLSGQSCDMEKIKNLSKEYGFKIIEDASHALGAKYKDKPVGSCFYSDIVVFSFHPVKMITTCEGGACLTNDKNLYERIYNLRSHGIVRNKKDMVNKNSGSWYYEQKFLGFNYRLNDLQSALGINQIKRLDLFIKKRYEIVNYYNQLFENNSNIIRPFQLEDSFSSFHLYIIKVSNKEDFNRDKIFESLRNNGYYVNVHYIPIYRHPFYSNNFNLKDYPNSEEYYSKAISLPIYPYLNKKHIRNVVDIINNKVNYQNLF